MSCISCGISTDKYKCPHCLERYCSLTCYKTHKEISCKGKQCKELVEVNEPSKHEPTIHEPFKTEDTVSKERLELLRTSEGLRTLLYNPHLRNLLHEIDGATNPRSAMCLAMQEPLFLEFADECLRVVEPMDNSDD